MSLLCDAPKPRMNCSMSDPGFFCEKLRSLSIMALRRFALEFSKKRPRARPWKKRTSPSLSQNPSVSILLRSPFNLAPTRHFRETSNHSSYVEEVRPCRPLHGIYICRPWSAPFIRHTPGISRCSTEICLANLPCLVPLSQPNPKDTSFMIATGLVEATKPGSQKRAASFTCLLTNPLVRHDMIWSGCCLKNDRH